MKTTVSGRNLLEYSRACVTPVCALLCRWI